MAEADVLESIRNHAEFIIFNLEQTEAQIINQILASQNSLGVRILNAEDAILETIVNQHAATRASIDANTNRILDSVNDSVTIISNRISEINDRVEEAILTAVQSLGSQLLAVINDALGRIEQKITGVIDTVESLGLVIKDQISSVAQQIDKETEEIDLALQFSVIPRLMAVQRDVDTILQEQLDIDVAIRESTGAIIEQMKKQNEESIAASAFKAIEFVLKEIFQFGSPPPDTTDKDLNVIFDKFYKDVNNIALVRVLNDGLREENPFLALVHNAFVKIALGWGMINAHMSVGTERMIQEIRSRERTAVLSPPDAVAAFLRKGITEQTLTDHLARNGFPDHLIEAILVLSRNLLNKDEILALWLRDEIDEQAVTVLLKEHGYPDDSIDKLKSLAFPIPPVQDLIVMAVREVFSPEVAEQFGQFDDFPQAFADEAKKHGLTEEWAKRYWGAHWDLPSPTMAFEMFHRRIIDESELNLLLRALDIMPFWRDKMIQLSFNPLTRVDVRRMHAVGVLDRQEVFNAYLDIGYSPENAERLTQFTEKLNAENDSDLDPELEKLTRAAVTSLYGDGALDRATALSLLVAMGIGETAADLYLTIVDLKEQTEERKAEKDLILAQFDAGQLTFADAQSRLGTIGLETAEQAKAVATLAKRQSARTKLPSRADLDRMVKAELISDSEYLLTMNRLGFSSEWAQRFLALAKRGENGGTE